MRWNIIVECFGEDGKRSTITLAPSNGSPGVRLRKTLESICRNRSRLRIGCKTPQFDLDTQKANDQAAQDAVNSKLQGLQNSP
jgi:hypothetical protein